MLEKRIIAILLSQDKMLANNTMWYTIAKNLMTYNAEGKRIRSENLAGQITTTAWDCCHKVSETQPDGSTTTWDYDADGLMIASSRLIPLDMTNVTWLTTCYRYDDLGRQVAMWQTNYAAQVGLPVTRTRYDQLGRVCACVDQLGNTTTTTYSPGGRTVSVHSPNGSTRITARSASGDTLSITGSAITPEFHTYGVLADGTRWSRTVQGETADSPRFTKRYENFLGQAIREERSGFQGAVLATTHSYDSLGRLASAVSMTLGQGNIKLQTSNFKLFLYNDHNERVASVDDRNFNNVVDWTGPDLISSNDTRYVSIDGAWWRESRQWSIHEDDSAASQLIGVHRSRVTGLGADNLVAESVSIDQRGNATTNRVWRNRDEATEITETKYPTAQNAALSVVSNGLAVMSVSQSCVTNTFAYDALNRQIAATDGRGNTTRTEYDALGRVAATIDALGHATTYGYDALRRQISVTDPLTNTVYTAYDAEGHVVSQRGATYPVDYSYDEFGEKIAMTTYRNAGGPGFVPAAGDTTTWLRDEATGLVTNKVYADGKGPTYTYTPDGKLATRTWARGIVTTYSYDDNGSLTNTVYSDGTPTISLVYNRAGRQIEAHDAAGVTTFLYDSFGSIANETVIGVPGTNTIIRHWDSFGRSTGCSLVGLADPCQPQRQSTLSYDPATGRLATMLANGSDTPFTWNYLPGTDLKSSLLYPNGLTASWAYDANNQLLQVCNATQTNVISQYDYTYDAAGRRINVSKTGTAFTQADSIAYGYNEKSELTNAIAAVDSDYRYAYDFDDIGNRISSVEGGMGNGELGTGCSAYIANNLNQYTSISNSASPCETFVPQFDDDGNQTLIKTATGIWQVQYNGENRPVLWTLINSSTYLDVLRPHGSSRNEECTELCL